MKQVTPEFIDKKWHEMWDEAESAHGLPTDVPPSVRDEMSERLRALWVAHYWQQGKITGSLHGAMNSHSIAEKAYLWVADACGERSSRAEKTSAPQKATKRKDRWDSFVRQIRGESGKEFTTEELVNLSGFSYPATLSFVKNNPLFVHVKKGVWKVSVEAK